MTAGNDVVDLSKWNGTLSVNIGDAFSGDNDKVTVRADALAGLVAKDNLKLTSIENLEIVNSGETNPVILKGANFKGLEVVKLIGDDTTLDVSDLTQGIKVDATANADNIIGSKKADTINGGDGNDTINAGSGNDVLTGGNGADTFVVGSVQSLGIDKILDFSADDKISVEGFAPKALKKFDASTFSTVNYKSLDAALATFLTGGKYQTKAGDVVIFSYDGATYALLSKGEGFNDATDSLVDITGTNVASLTESNFGTSGNFGSYADFKAAVDAGKVDSPTTIKSITANDAAALLTTDVAYLDKIALGGIGAVTGAPVSVTMAATTFDASKFAAKLAAGVNLNITGTAGDDTIISPLAGSINGGVGADTINASAATDAVTINGGDGADSIIGGAGYDVITVSAGGNQITGRAGNDNITLATGGSASGDSDTVVFAANATDNGVDTITNFKAGQKSSGGDVLDVSAFLGASISYVAADASSSAATVDSGKNVVAVKGNKGIKFNAADVGKQVVVIQQNSTTSNNADVFYYTVKNGDDATAVKTFTDQVATLVGVSDANGSLDATNFA